MTPIVAGQPLGIAIAVELQGMISYGLKGLSIEKRTVLIERINPDQRLPVVKFICKDVLKERLDEFYWHPVKWYVQHHLLLKQTLN